MEIVIWAAFGVAAGVALRFVMPQATRGTLLTTSLLGIGGAVVGAWVGRLLGFYRAGQPMSFVMAVIGAVIVLTAYDFAASRR